MTTPQKPSPLPPQTQEFREDKDSVGLRSSEDSTTLDAKRLDWLESIEGNRWLSAFKCGGEETTVREAIDAAMQERGDEPCDAPNQTEASSTSPPKFNPEGGVPPQTPKVVAHNQDLGDNVRPHGQHNEDFAPLSATGECVPYPIDHSIINKGYSEWSQSTRHVAKCTRCGREIQREMHDSGHLSDWKHVVTSPKEATGAEVEEEEKKSLGDNV